MPKGEGDFDDPLMLTGVALPGDRNEAMARCFIEEYVMLGYSEEAILRLFRDPFYRATHRVWTEKGEPYVQALIKETLHV